MGDADKEIVYTDLEKSVLVWSYTAIADSEMPIREKESSYRLLASDDVTKRIEFLTEVQSTKSVEIDKLLMLHSIIKPAAVSQPEQMTDGASGHDGPCRGLASTDQGAHVYIDEVLSGKYLQAFVDSKVFEMPPTSFEHGVLLRVVGRRRYLTQYLCIFTGNDADKLDVVLVCDLFCLQVLCRVMWRNILNCVPHFVFLIRFLSVYIQHFDKSMPSKIVDTLNQPDLGYNFLLHQHSHNCSITIKAKALWISVLEVTRRIVKGGVALNRDTFAIACNVISSVQDIPPPEKPDMYSKMMASGLPLVSARWFSSKELLRRSKIDPNTVRKQGIALTKSLRPGLRSTTKPTPVAAPEPEPEPEPSIEQGSAYITLQAAVEAAAADVHEEEDEFAPSEPPVDDFFIDLATADVDTAPAKPQKPVKLPTRELPLRAASGTRHLDPDIVNPPYMKHIPQYANHNKQTKVKPVVAKPPPVVKVAPVVKQAVATKPAVKTAAKPVTAKLAPPPKYSATPRQQARIRQQQQQSILQAQAQADMQVRKEISMYKKMSTKSPKAIALAEFYARNEAKKYVQSSPRVVGREIVPKISPAGVSAEPSSLDANSAKLALGRDPSEAQASLYKFSDVLLKAKKLQLYHPDVYAAFTAYAMLTNGAGGDFCEFAEACMQQFSMLAALARTSGDAAMESIQANFLVSKILEVSKLQLLVDEMMTQCDAVDAMVMD